MDAVKILIPFFILLGTHIWAKRWTWVPTWSAIATVIIAAEILANFQPPLVFALMITGAFGVVLSGFLFWVWKASNKRTISRDIWALFNKQSPEYSPLKGYLCVASWLLFAVYLALHFLFHW